MNQLATVVLASVFLSLCFPFSIVPTCEAVAHAQQPAYAKWGRLAVAETAKKYPGAQIVDYLHVGYRQASPSTGEETFKLWLRQDRREWGVYVRILFDMRSERVLSITFQETHR